MISHIEIKIHVYAENFYLLRIGMDVGDPTKVPTCALLLKSDEFFKYWCYKRGNTVVVTRYRKNFRIYEVKIYKV